MTGVQTCALPISRLEVEANRAVLLTPRLVNGADSADLPAVGIYGRRRYYYYVRNGASMLSGDGETSFKAAEKPEPEHAPEIEEDELRDDRPLRNQVDLDSMDWLNFLLGLHRELKVEIPEADYARLVTLNDVTAYLLQRV